MLLEGLQMKGALPPFDYNDNKKWICVRVCDAISFFSFQKWEKKVKKDKSGNIRSTRSEMHSGFMH